MLSSLIFHRFSSIFINFHSFLRYVVVLSCRHTFFRKFYLSWTPPWTLSLHFSPFFINFHSFSLIFCCHHSFFIVFHRFSSFFIVFHQFSLIFTLCRRVVMSSYFFRKIYPVHGHPLGHFPEHMNNRKFSINNLSRRLKFHLPPSFMRADSTRSVRKAQCVCVLVEAINNVSRFHTFLNPIPVIFVSFGSSLLKRIMTLG